MRMKRVRVITAMLAVAAAGLMLASCGNLVGSMLGEITAGRAGLANTGTYTVTYDGNGHSSGAVPVDGTVYASGDTVSVAENSGYLLKIKVNDASYRFTGWNTVADGSGTEYAAGSGTFSITSNVTLYAQWTAYAVGDVGPAGGWVFYDAGDYTTYGWRYLEAGTEDLGPSCWGDWLTSYATGTVIGTGADNTILIVGKDTVTTNKAVDLCSEYSVINDDVVYDDWFLPSKDELDLMYDNLYLEGIGNFNTSQLYWSSSESESYTCAYQQDFSNGSQNKSEKDYSHLYSRPARSF